MKKYFDYLDQLRQSGETNMFGAVPYLQKQFFELALDREKAVQVLQTWMSGFESSQAQAEGYSSEIEADAIFLFGDFIGDLAAHLAETNPETKCLLCAHHNNDHKCDNSLFCISGIQKYLMKQAAQYHDRMESCCKKYFEYLDHLNSLGTYDQYTAEAALKVEFPYLASHEEYAKYAMASWMLKNRG